MKRSFLNALIAASAITSANLSLAQTWSALDLGEGIVATAMNAHGQVVGFSTAAGGAERAFVTGANGIGITDLGTLYGTGTFATGINSNGQVVGWAYNAGANAQTAFSTGTGGVGLSDMGTFGGYYSRAESINDSGKITVTVQGGNSQTYVHPFITSPNGTTDLGSLGGLFTTAKAINAKGQIIGNATGNSPPALAYISVSEGDVTILKTLASLGGTATYANDVNASGRVVGQSLTSGDESAHAFITGDNGIGTTDLGTLGVFGVGLSNSSALGINAHGQVVGYSYTANSIGALPYEDHAFITGPNGVNMTDLNSLYVLGNGSYFTSAIDINDAGQILAASNSGRYYLLSVNSVPELNSQTMLLVGIGLLGCVILKRRAKQT